MIRAATALAAATPFLLAGASAQDAGAYVQAHGGAFFATQDDVNADFEALDLSASLDYGTGLAVGALVGYEVAPSLSVEGEVTYRFVSGDQTDTEVEVMGEDVTTRQVENEVDAGVFAFMANARYSFASDARFTPYVVGGVGYATLNIEGQADDIDTDGAFAYQVKAGVTVPAGQGDLGAEVGYFGTGDFDASEDDAVSYEYAGATLLATYAFGF